MAELNYSYDAGSIDTTPGGDSVKSSILEKNQARVEQALTHLNAHKNRADSHGTTSAIVGVDDAQTLNNKTLIDPVVTYAAEPAQNAPVTREWVEGQSDLAVTQAGTARDEAVTAKDEAVAARDVAVDAAANLKITPTPVLSGNSPANEGEETVITITNHVEGNVYDVAVTGGSAVVSGGQITWTLPSVDIDTDFTMTVYAAKFGFQQSVAATHTVTVKDVPIQDGPTMTFADTVEGYPGATVDADGVHTPAHSVGCDNINQIISAKGEVEITSGELDNITNVSVGGFDTTTPLEVGDEIEADTGSSSVDSVSGGGTTTVETSQAGASNSFGSTFMNNNYPLPNGERIDALGLKSSSAQTGYLFIYRQDSATEYTCVARVELTHSGSGLLEYAELDTPYDVPSTGVFYVAGANFNTAGAYMYDTSALRANPVDAVVGETLTFAATTVAPVTGYQYGSMYAVTVNPPFSVAPTKVFKKPTGLALKLGAGVVGEYMGPEIPLAWGTGSNTSDLVFESSESLAEKMVKPNGPPVGGMGAELIPSFAGVTYDTESGSSTVDGWVISESHKVNDSYAAYMLRRNDGATSVPGYTPSWAITGTPGFAYITAPNPVKLGAIVLGGGIPGGLTQTPPENVTVEGFDGTDWISIATINETRWTENWQEFEYAVGDVPAYTEFRIGMPAYSVLHKIQLKEASNLTYTADQNALHNDIEIDGAKHKVSQVVEKSTARTEEATPAQSFYSYGYVSKYYVNNRVKVPNGKTISELGIWTDSENTVPYRLCIFKKLSGDNLEIVARTASHVFSTGEEWQSLESPFSVPETGDYYVGAGVPSGASEGRITWPEATDPFSGWLCEDFASDALGSTGAFTLYQYTSNVGYRFAGSLYTTTATLVTPLAQAPDGTEAVKIPDRCNLTPAALTAQVVSGQFKITSDMISLVDDPNIKRLAIAVAGTEPMTFRSGKIYIKEKL